MSLQKLTFDDRLSVDLATPRAQRLDDGAIVEGVVPPRLN